MSNRIAFALAACVGWGISTYAFQGDTTAMISAWAAFAISAMYMPDKGE